ncbi:MAG TPA: sulfatase-like hydrolase/transferase, partial [Bryobacteraceae bacterium]|nr:sulfatase-like hydrolase/transferase [Bryobacteraceae bacterium]
MKTSRRSFLACAAGTAVQAQRTTPNIVLVLSDDHSYPYLGCYGSGTRTPVFDAFASAGMRFDNMFTAAPQCVPSRAAFMTGRSPVAVRMGRFSSPLPPDVKTVPEHLRAAGYYTGVCRRNYHLDGPWPGRNGALFQQYEEMGLTTWQKRVDFLDRSGNRDHTGTVMGKFLDAVPKGRPFFLWVNFSDPHHPWDGQSKAGGHDAASLTVPGHLPDLPGVRADLARY